VIGVLDVDSQRENRFDAADEAFLVAIAELYLRSLDG
jgi:putative methionine-R-sulfoxide reductase with GAF domain